MTPSEHPHPVRPHGPIHLVVPKRPGADLDLLRAKLEGVPALQEHDVVWHVPDQRGDIVRDAAQAALADGGLVVAAGGDGTINAVASAALRAGVPLGVVPMGTFNYFSREHGLALDPEAAVQDMLQALRNGDLRPVQVGFVNRRMFVVNASVGLYPKMLADREMASRRFGRKPAAGANSGRRRQAGRGHAQAPRPLGHSAHGVERGHRAVAQRQCRGQHGLYRADRHPRQLAPTAS